MSRRRHLCLATATMAAAATLAVAVGLHLGADGLRILTVAITAAVTAGLYFVHGGDR